MKSVGTLILAVLLLGACRTESERSKRGPVLLAPEQLNCERLLPPESREGILPGSTLSAERLCEHCGPLCVLRSSLTPEVQVSLGYDCQARYDVEEVQPLLGPTLRSGGTEAPAIGRAAAQRTPAPGMKQVVAWDLDTPCALIVTWLGGDEERVLDATRAALQVLTPDRVHAPVEGL